MEDHEMKPVEKKPAYGKYAQRMLAESGIAMEPAEPAVFGALQAKLDELLAGVRPVQMLDAGCGKKREVSVADECYVVGVDISAAEISANERIDEAIVGDIQTCELGESRFDVIMCWNVLEHVEEPTKALLNFKSALKPQGVLIVAVPHAASVKGVITRFTPYWFHGWVRHILDGEVRRAEPFPTVMASSIKPKRLCAFARSHDLAVELVSEYESWEQKKLRVKLRLTGRAFRGIQGVVRAASLGMVTADVTDVIVVMRKRGYGSPGSS